jgi:integrase
MLRTKSGLPKHCSWNTDQHGKRRVRFRKAGFTIYLTGIPWSEDFMRQYAAAVEGVKAQASNVGIERTKPGSFNALCVSYYRSPEFHGLKASTQALRRNIIERWSEAEAARFEAVYPIGTKERLALALLLYTGQRVSDVARMGWQHVKGKWIAVRQEKTDTPLMLKMHPDLVRILAAVPRSNLTFLVTDRGAAFSAAGLSNWFGKRCRAAGLSHCTAHGLRKLALTRRANAGEHRDAKGVRRAQDLKKCRALHPFGKSSPVGRARSRTTVESRTRTGFVQPRNPVGQKWLKGLSHQWPNRKMKTRRGFLLAGPCQLTPLPLPVHPWRAALL